MTEAICALAARAGILPDYIDQTGKRRVTPDDTRLALLQAMGLPSTRREAAEALAEMDANAAARSLPPWVVCNARKRPALEISAETAWSLHLESGEECEGCGPGQLPELPLGIHRLVVSGHETWLLSAPPRLPLPRRSWGVTAPLFGLRSPDQGGLGDYRDLGDAAAGLAEHGASFLGINPVHAGFLTEPDWFSPYSPSHRRRFNPLHLPTGARPSDRGPLIDYRKSKPEILHHLRAAFDRMSTHQDLREFEAFRRAEGPELRRFAIHQALSARYGALWSHWPAGLRDPDGAAVDAEAVRLSRDVDFHAWLQWRCHVELANAAKSARSSGMEHGLYLDLAVGTHPAGAETWEDHASFAHGVSLGAPPDAFAEDGQYWDLAPFNPRTLASRGFKALAETLRAQQRYAGLLRIDHILGYDRAFWLPRDRSLPGAYVAMPRAAMLAVVRIEAARAGAAIVGEDLGNIPDGLQADLDKAGILGCRVVMFEDDRSGPDVRFRAPSDYPEATIASFSTHDLPTWVGWRQGTDIATREAIGQIDSASAETETLARAEAVAAFDAASASGTPEDPSAMWSYLARTGSRLVAVQAEDLAGLAAQPNLPGTIASYPNWRQRLPVRATDLVHDPRVAHAAEIMRAADRCGASAEDNADGPRDETARRR